MSGPRVASVAGLAAAGLLGAAAALSPLSVVILLAVTVAMLVLVLIPYETLPSAALVVFAAFPASVLPGHRYTASLPPVMAVLVIWLARSLGRQGRDVPGQFAAILLGVWLVISALRSQYHYASGLWMLDGLAFLVLPVWLARTVTPKASELFQTTWLRLGGILGVYAIIESSLGRNPISWLQNNFTFTQIWSQYRVTTTIGFPILTGIFLGCAVVIAFDRATRRVVPWEIASGALAAIGMVLTYSRSSIAATGAGLILVVTFRLIRSRGDFMLRLLTTAAVIAALIWVVGTIASRSASYEGETSTFARQRAVTAALQLAPRSHYLGTGPGTSYRTMVTVGGIDYALTSSIENSYAQMLVSLGIPGLGLVLLLIMRALLRALRIREYGPAALVVTIAVGAAGFSMAEDNVPALSLLGLAMMLGLAAGRRAGQEQAASARLAALRPLRFPSPGPTQRRPAGEPAEPVPTSGASSRSRSSR